MRSPARALRKHTYHATFAQHKARVQEAAPCPAHSYVTAGDEIAVLPKKAGLGGVSFGNDARQVSSTGATCPVHVYADAKSMLKETAATFAKHDESSAMPDAPCPVHAYATPASSFKQTAATFPKFASPRMGDEPGCGPPVHAYSTPRSTLNSNGAIAFSMEKRLHAFQQPGRDVAPVHTYAGPVSSLSRKGAGTFGAAVGSRAGWTASLSRTGLVPATVGGASPRPRALRPRPRPKLAPLPDTEQDQATAIEGDGGLLAEAAAAA